MLNLIKAYIGLLLILVMSFSQPANAECAEASWIPFDVELYAPETESSIELRAFKKGYVDASAVRLIKFHGYSEDVLVQYNPLNIRAIIRLVEKEIYIDRFGWVRQGDKYGKIDISDVEDKFFTPCDYK